MAKKKKKPKKSTLNKKLDAIWSKIIRLSGECEYCGLSKFLNAHHCYGRRARSVRWDLDNGFCLCPLHHKWSTEFSAHETPLLFTAWAVKKRGKAWDNRLRKKHRIVYKPTIDELQDLLIELEREYENRERKII